ncbi:hypothetical protein QN219_23450 [Sinorhizobium sp. 7-81]|uniref:hypothetical protein n=1 Tax=unclassified Sinorhizobium TaxID=2613772 RepID=UPI0024C3E88B|nr:MULTISPECIES: hypothetical protein [unclassified Sinorhizobium]MDK1389331.1 hypothetical protein [Sinorhizobium sp. 7-81]MDK1492972.1 hypothetical protein [Sinorhizobium sp. 8-89]
MDLDETIESARQTIVQMDSLLRKTREQLTRCAQLVRDNAMNSALIAAGVEDEDEDFQRPYWWEEVTLSHVVPSAPNSHIPRVKPTRQRI